MFNIQITKPMIPDNDNPELTTPENNNAGDGYINTDNGNAELITDPEDRDGGLTDGLSVESDNEDLNYNAETNSYEFDVKGDDPDYDHPDPYDTAVKNGEDFNSTYDEANPYDT